MASKKSDKKWIAGAIKRPGAFTAKAKKAGKSVAGMAAAVTKNPNKSAYFYLLTPQGLKEKSRLTSGFVKRKMAEYHALKKEIELIKSIL